MKMLHGCCIVTIVMLSAYALFDHMGDHGALLMSELQQVFSAGLDVITDANNELRLNLEENKEDLPSKQMDRYFELVERNTEEFERLLALLDSLECHPNPDLIAQIQGRVHLFQSSVWKDMDYSPEIRKRFPQLPNYGWLFDAYESGNRGTFLTVIKELKLGLAMTQQIFLQYCSNRTSGIIERGDTYRLSAAFHTKAPRVGEPIDIDVYVVEIKLQNLRHFYLDGQELPSKDGITPFELRYTHPGLYPLKLLAIQENKRTHKRDSVESVYYLRVRE